MHVTENDNNFRNATAARMLNMPWEEWYYSKVILRGTFLISPVVVLGAHRMGCELQIQR